MNKITAKWPYLRVVFVEIVIDEDVLFDWWHSVIAEYDEIEITARVESARFELLDEWAEWLVELSECDVEFASVEAVFVGDRVWLIVVETYELKVVVDEPFKGLIEFDGEWCVVVVWYVGVEIGVVFFVVFIVFEMGLASWPMVYSYF